MNKLFHNTLTHWLARSVQARWLERKYRQQYLKIGYNSFAVGCGFGMYNVLYNDVSLTNVHLGDATYIANGSTLANTTIGKFCSIGPGVRSGLGIHPTDFVSTHPIFYSPKKQSGQTFADQEYFEENKPVAIGHDVWVGANAIIADGVTISIGAIIGAGAVVTKDVAPYAIVGGVPAKIIRYRFSPEIIEQLLMSKWWDREWDWLKTNWQAFRQPKDVLDLQT